MTGEQFWVNTDQARRAAGQVDEASIRLGKGAPTVSGLGEEQGVAKWGVESGPRDMGASFASQLSAAALLVESIKNGLSEFQKSVVKTVENTAAVDAEALVEFNKQADQFAKLPEPSSVPGEPSPVGAGAQDTQVGGFARKPGPSPVLGQDGGGGRSGPQGHH